MLNTIVLIGRTTKDPELRYTGSGKAVANVRLAVDRGTTNPQGEKETDFIDIVIWEKQAETVANHVKKGRLIAVKGRLQIRSFENQEGQRRERAEVVAETVRILEWDNAANPNGNPGNGNAGNGNAGNGNAGNGNAGNGNAGNGNAGNGNAGNGNAGGMGSEPNFQDDDDVPF